MPVVLQTMSHHGVNVHALTCSPHESHFISSVAQHWDRPMYSWTINWGHIERSPCFLLRITQRLGM